MTAEEQAQLVEGLRFAASAHSGQRRRGTSVPYVSHLIQVAGLVMEHGGDIDQIVAGLLHDVIEDCEDVDRASLGIQFGAEVVRIVEICSDLLETDTPNAKSAWLPRKRYYISKLREADPRAQLIVACDKLHNLRSLIADLKQSGVETLTRFNATPAQTRWYYDEVREVLGPDLPASLIDEIDALIEQLRDFVPQASPED